MAAQAVAVHFASMKVANSLGSRSYLDPRTAAALAALSRTYAGQVETFRAINAPRSKRQTIKVQKNVTVNYRDEKHVHFPAGGSEECGDQSHATRGQRAGARPAEITVECPALPGPDSIRETVPVPCGEGETSLPNARRTGGRSKGQGER